MSKVSMFNEEAFRRLCRPWESEESIQRHVDWVNSGRGLVFGTIESATGGPPTASGRRGTITMWEQFKMNGPRPVMCLLGQCDCVPEHFRGDDTVPLMPHVVGSMRRGWR